VAADKTRAAGDQDFHFPTSFDSLSKRFHLGHQAWTIHHDPATKNTINLRSHRSDSDWKMPESTILEMRIPFRPAEKILLVVVNV
jgi:hypothetical protein